MRENSFNVVHAAIALLCVIVVVTLILPMSCDNRRTPARRMQNSTQLRGIHQGLVTYAQSNQDWFPGINELGEDATLSVEKRFQILIENHYFTPEYAISPSETEALTEWDEWNDEDADPVTTDNYSYAMLQIPKEGGRRDEWRVSLNSQAIVLSDRNTGTKAKPASIHTESKGPWSGSVLWNDNHVGFENTDAYETRYGEADRNEADRLFESDGTDDALLIYSGNGKD